MAAGRTYSLTSFVGRRKETLELCRLTDAHRLITLVGAGGVGKTRLGYQVFDTLTADLEDGAWAVELADLTDAGLLGHAVAEAVGAPVLTEAFDVSAVVTHIGSRSAFLFIDNCEHLVGECAVLVEALLARCPNLCVIATSREGLGLVGEVMYTVPQLDAQDGTELFVARAGAVMPTWVPADRDREAIVAMCARLDGVALAIELAASRMRLLPLEAISDEVGDQLTAWVSKSGSAPRRTSLEACLYWSYDLCSPQEQAVWARLSVFAGSFALSSAEAVCQAADLPAASVDLALAGLVEKSLVERDPQDPNGRYRLLEVVRQFGAARLEEWGEVDIWRRRHRDHFLELAEQFESEWVGPNQLAWINRFRADHANLRQAFEFSVNDPEEAPAALRMCTVLEHYFASRGGGSEALHWLRLACQHGTGTLYQKAAALRVGCFIACLLTEFDAAREFYDAIVPLAEESGDDAVRARALYAGAVLQTWQNDARTGAELADEAIRIFAELGDRNREANLHFLRGMMLGWADRPEEAAAEYQMCLDMTQPFGERWFATYAQWGLGVDRLLAGKIDEAVQLEREALQAKAAFGDLLGTGLTLEALAWAAVDQHNGPFAALLSGATETIWLALGIPVAGMPYLLRRRDQSLAALQGFDLPNYQELRELGQTLPLAQVVDIALGLAPVPAGRSIPELTRREREIALMVARGATNQAIADELFLSRRTVESHVDRILRKLNLSSRTQVRDVL